MPILIFLVILFVLILVHEWGHFIVAKKTGMKVEEFGIGFPPKLFGVKKGETEYTFNLFPIGGFVKILGEDGERRPEDLIEVGEGEKDTANSDSARSFSVKPRWAQAAVLVAGVTMNILLAWVLFISVFLIGLPVTVTEEEATAAAELTITDILPGSPAELAGLKPGMVVVGLQAGGENIPSLTPSDFSGFTETYAGQSMTVVVNGSGENHQFMVTPVTGLISDDPDRPAVGVALSLVETTSYPFLAALKEGTIATYSTLAAIFVGVGHLIVQALTLSADLSQVAGPVGIVGLVGEAAAFGVTSLLTFVAVISLNLAVINLLPVPALDGGRLLFVAVEGITRRSINPIWMARVNLVGFSLLILLMILISINDIFYK